MKTDIILQATAELSREAGIEHNKFIVKEGIGSSQALNLTKKSDLNQFFVSTDTSFIGKPQALNESKVQLSLAHKLIKKNSKGKKINEFLFIHNSIDGRELKVYGKKTLSDEFFLYKTIAQDREYVLLSREKLNSVEQEFTGMVLQSTSSTEINRRFSLRGYVNLFFVGSAKPTIRILDIEELKKITKNISITNFLDYLFYHDVDKRIYKQPEDYSKLLGAILLSGKYEGYPLHLITIGGPGLGKTKKQESLDYKFRENRGIFEASNSRMKGLIPSFKERPASQGYILECNRIALVDELFKMIESAFNDSHSSSSSIGNVLQQFNPLLEHKKRTISSGNDNSLCINPTAKLVSDCNPLSNKYTLPEHLNVLDVSTLSRAFIWVIDSEHYRFIEAEKANTGNALLQGNPPMILNYNEFLSIYDTLNSFVSKIDVNEVQRLFKGVSSQLNDERLMPLWKARGIHHTFLLVDGLVKLRCVFDDKSMDFVADKCDYDFAEKLLLRMIQNMQSPIARGSR